MLPVVNTSNVWIISFTTPIHVSVANPLSRHAHRFTLDRPRLKCIVNDGDPPRKDTKLLLLEEGVTLESKCVSAKDQNCGFVLVTLQVLSTSLASVVPWWTYRIE